MELWLACPNKAELISNALHNVPYTPKIEVKEHTVERKIDSLNIPGVQRGSEVFKPAPPDPELGYPCCQKTKPCIHWVWDGIASVYKNTLTGATKEV